MTWFEHIGTIRWKTKLSPRLREIAIVRFAQAMHYAYALNQHVPHIAVPDGVSLEECQALKDWRASGKFSDSRARGARLCRRHDCRPRRARRRVRGAAQHYSEREVVELTVLVGTYFMHNRVFSALKADIEPRKA